MIPARQSDPETSHQAARTLTPTQLEDKVLTALKLHPAGATTHELAAMLKLSLVTVSPRMAPLSRKGLVVDSGRRKCGESGRRSIVWRLAFRLEVCG